MEQNLNMDYRGFKANGFVMLFLILAMIAELFNEELKLDDNFSIPLCSGAVLFVCSLF